MNVSRSPPQLPINEDVLKKVNLLVRVYVPHRGRRPSSRRAAAP